MLASYFYCFKFVNFMWLNINVEGNNSIISEHCKNTKSKANNK